MSKLITIERHILEQQKNFPEATGELTDLLSDVAFAAKLVRREVVRAGLVDILGFAGSTNVQGEEVKKLDLFANDKIINAIGQHGRFAIMGSEENEEIIIPPNNEKGSYALLFDPLDGSSNIDVNVSVGTIFSIYKIKNSDPRKADISDCLQKGSEQVAAGYVIYGSSVVMVYTTGHGVHGFTYDPTIGEFLLSHENIVTRKAENTIRSTRVHTNSSMRKQRNTSAISNRRTPQPIGHTAPDTSVHWLPISIATCSLAASLSIHLQKHTPTESFALCMKATPSHTSVSRRADGQLTEGAAFSTLTRANCISAHRST